MQQNHLLFPNISCRTLITYIKCEKETHYTRYHLNFVQNQLLLQHKNFFKLFSYKQISPLPMYNCFKNGMDLQPIYGTCIWYTTYSPNIALYVRKFVPVIGFIYFKKACANRIKSFIQKRDMMEQFSSKSCCVETTTKMMFLQRRHATRNSSAFTTRHTLAKITLSLPPYWVFNPYKVCYWMDFTLYLYLLRLSLYFCLNQKISYSKILI